MPSAGLMFFDCWNFTTAAVVAGPKFPSAVPVRKFSAISFCWRVTTSGPDEPCFRTGRLAGLIVVVVVAVEPFLVVAVAVEKIEGAFGVAAGPGNVVPGTSVLLGASVVPDASLVLADRTPPSGPSFGTTASRITVAMTASPMITIPLELNSRVSKAVSLETYDPSCAARRPRTTRAPVRSGDSQWPRLAVAAP